MTALVRLLKEGTPVDKSKRDAAIALFTIAVCNL
jgi:hypothetical protein